MPCLCGLLRHFEIDEGHNRRQHTELFYPQREKKKAAPNIKVLANRKLGTLY